MNTITQTMRFMQWIIFRSVYSYYSRAKIELK